MPSLGNNKAIASYSEDLNQFEPQNPDIKEEILEDSVDEGNITDNKEIEPIEQSQGSEINKQSQGYYDEQWEQIEAA